MSNGILATNIHLEGADNYLDATATLTLKAGSVLSVQAAHTSALLDALTGAAKGSIAVRSGSAWALLAVGTNGQALVADSSQANGVKWGTGGLGRGAILAMINGSFYP